MMNDGEGSIRLIPIVISIICGVFTFILFVFVIIFYVNKHLQGKDFFIQMFLLVNDNGLEAR